MAILSSANELSSPVVAFLGAMEAVGILTQAQHWSSNFRNSVHRDTITFMKQWYLSSSLSTCIKVS